MSFQPDGLATSPARVFQAGSSVRAADGGNVDAFDHSIASARKPDDDLADAPVMAREIAVPSICSPSMKHGPAGPIEGRSRMEATGPAIGERVIDVREIHPRVRHTVILQLFEHLDDRGSLQVIADHDPKPLRLELESKHGTSCRWTYLEQGPEIWRVRLHQNDRRRVRTCGSC